MNESLPIQTDPDMDRAFRALADPNRRTMLDRLEAEPGLSVGELAASFRFTRYAVMKHLRTLESAGLVVRRKSGRTTRLYLNVVPIQTIHDRWISKYSALWASRLTSLKYQLESKEEDMMTATRVQQVHVIYIRTTPEKLWDALTNADLTRQYFHATEIEGELAVGGTINYVKTDGSRQSALTGEILEIEPGKKLVHTFSFPSMKDAPSKATYELEPMGEVVKLSVTHSDFDGETETFKMVQGGWPPILSGLKTLLETGEALKLG